MIVKVNEYTIQKYRYEFFNMGNFLISAVGYGLLYFGYKWYMSALEKNQDILNGQILIGIGVILILTVIYYNIKNTSGPTGLALSLVQAPIYSVLAVFSLIVLIAAVAFFSETKPVYNINDD
jgi:vacuolar-type H+-ATPase subunit I/STV1